VGEGLLPGSILTLSAKHGTGKTQFALQLLEELASTHRVGYLSNEETVEQLAFTCKRINAFNVPIGTCSTVNDVVKATAGLDVLVVDSFSKLQVAKVKSTLKTEKIALKNIIAAAKRNKCCVVLITHNTKTGQSKGTSQVQHDVDATLYIEKLKDEPTLRKVWFDKNRFGAPAEIHLEMTASGLILELRASPEEAAEAPKPSKTQQLYAQVLDIITSEGTVDAGVIARRCGVDYSRSQVLLRELGAMGQVVKHGRGKEATYELSQELMMQL
jgi:predicted ATP-dependent serine protease/predicted transcriptional regulator